MSTHNIGFYDGKAILMSTHNIGFYEDLTKIIFELSFNIIKYTPYFFCCVFQFVGDPQDRVSHVSFNVSIFLCILYMVRTKSRVMRKPTFWFPTWSDTNQAVQLQKMARGLKFWI